MEDLTPKHASRLSRRNLLLGGGALLPALASGPSNGAKPIRFLLEWGKRGQRPGEFDIPIGLAIDRHDVIYVAEFRTKRVQKFDPFGNLVGSFPVPEQAGGIAVARDGTVYVSHLVPSFISVHDASGRQTAIWGRPGKGDGEFGQPGGIAIGKNGSVYVCDQINRRIQQFRPDGSLIRQWGKYGLGPGEFGGNEPPSSRTAGPQFVAVDRFGDLYTTEASVGRIQKFTAEGQFLGAWGSNSAEPGGFGGREKNLPGPIGIAVDRRGHVWVTSTNHRLQEFDQQGRFLRGLMEEGHGPGQFVTPHGLAFDSTGNLYVCDTQNGRIQKFNVGE